MRGARRGDSGRRILDSTGVTDPIRLAFAVGRNGRKSVGKWNRPKNIMENKTLQGRFDHVCVLFVQHPTENALHRPVSERSVVVCARSFGNCDWATEGASQGRPVLGGSLKSLAFIRVCPNARSD